MGDLLSIGRSGVLAYRNALAAVSENVVNADTPGFAKRTVRLTEAASTPGPLMLDRTGSTFNGVQTATVQRVWDQYRATNAWTSNSDSAFANARAQWLSTTESMLDDSDSGIGTRLTSVFTAGNALAANPGDATLRQSMLFAIGDAVGALGQTSANLGKSAATITSKATLLVGQVNESLAALAKVNTALRTAGSGTSARAQLEDQRDTLIDTISANVGVDVTIMTNGTASLKLNGYSGTPLLAANDTSPPTLSLHVAGDGRLTMTMSDNDIVSSAMPTSGELAGLIGAAGNIADRLGQLDALSTGFATAINTWQAQGKDAAGVAGVPLLTGTTALTMAVVVTDPAKIAAASATADNGNLLALTDLRGNDGVEAKWRAISTDQSLLVAAAKSVATSASTTRDGAYSALDEVSGVDLDAEAAELMRLQQAYAASTKIIQTARETLQQVLDLF